MANPVEREEKRIEEKRREEEEVRRKKKKIRKSKGMESKYVWIMYENYSIDVYGLLVGKSHFV